METLHPFLLFVVLVLCGLSKSNLSAKFRLQHDACPTADFKSDVIKCMFQQSGLYYSEDVNKYIKEIQFDRFSQSTLLIDNLTLFVRLIVDDVIFDTRSPCMMINRTNAMTEYRSFSVAVNGERPLNCSLKESTTSATTIIHTTTTTPTTATKTVTPTTPTTTAASTSLTTTARMTTASPSSTTTTTLARTTNKKTLLMSLSPSLSSSSPPLSSLSSFGQDEYKVSTISLAIIVGGCLVLIVVCFILHHFKIIKLKRVRLGNLSIEMSVNRPQPEPNMTLSTIANESSNLTPSTPNRRTSTPTPSGNPSDDPSDDPSPLPNVQPHRYATRFQKRMI